MARHEALARRGRIQGFFADPHRPWPRGSHENTNGRLREYRPKGAELSGYTPDDLNAMAWKLNHRSRKLHGFRTPLQVYNDLLTVAQMPDSTIH